VRSATAARATAVFNDVSVLGADYEKCYNAYNTCMDQVCWNASSEFRRCICSGDYESLRDMNTALDSAQIMIDNFNDINLMNVELTAGQVGAMSSATSGEIAAVADTSAMSEMLAQIGDLLSGKSTAEDSNKNWEISFNIDDAMQDIWTGGVSSDNVDLTGLSGDALYNALNSQCLSLASSSCTNDAMMNMVKNAYSIIIGQDCDLYEQAVERKKTQISDNLRNANNELRAARLREYMSHNSASMNECIANVKKEITSDSACGENYKRCLDFTGQFINVSTGEPIYSTRLFQLAGQIKLENPTAPENSAFIAGLNGYRNRAQSALDSCRDDADAVWDAFVNQALVEISQAQDRKLQEVKDSCVVTIKDCYNSTTETLNSTFEATSGRTAAASGAAAAAMCRDQVLVCSALYTPAGGTICTFDVNNKITNAETCGLKELLNFVNAMNSAIISSGCKSALESYITETCAPGVGDIDKTAPYGCRLMAPEKLLGNLQSYAKTFCADPNSAETTEIINQVMTNVRANMSSQLGTMCGASNGRWTTNANDVSGMSDIKLASKFVNDVYGSMSALQETLTSNYSVSAGGSSGQLRGVDTGRSALRIRARDAVGTGLGSTLSQADQLNNAMNNKSTGTTTITTTTGNGGTITLNKQPTNDTGTTTTGTNLRTNETTSGVVNNPLGNVDFAGIIASNLATTSGTTQSASGIGWGLCLYTNAAEICAAQDALSGGNGCAVYNSANDTCELSSCWYQARCESIGENGYWDQSARKCYF
jgi:hypothetical protein